MMLVVAMLTLAVPAAAQEEVQTWPDAISWGTAAFNPAMAVWRATRSSDPKCRLSQLLVSEGIGNAVAFTLQRFIISPRPCLGCRPNGAPSAHSMNSVIGITSGWRVDIGFGVGVGAAIGTAAGRVAARRHTKAQVIEGLLLGAASEWVGRSLVKCGP